MSLITSVIGGIMGGNAAGKAANAQVGGDQEAANTVQTAVDKGNQGISDASTAGSQNVLNAGSDAGSLVLGTAKQGADSVTNTAATGANGATTAAQLANVGLDPYAAAGAQAVGQLQTGLAPGGNLSKTFTAADMDANDPGYEFRLQQGQQALERQAAARGGVQGGGLLKSLTDYEQGAASSEYQNAFQRFTTQQQNSVNNLQKLADQGQTAATTQGGNTTQAAQYGGNLTTGAAGRAADLLAAGATYAGNMGVDTNKFASTQNVNSAEKVADNSNTAAQYVGNSQMNAGNARATGINAKQSAYNGMLNGIGGTLDSALAGGFGGGGYGLPGVNGQPGIDLGGGGGFTLRGAVNGALGRP